MTRRSTALTAALITAALAVSGCGSEESTSPAAAPSSEAPDSFQAVLEAAKGQTVDWYMYGGDDRLNGYVNGYVKDRLAELDITLNQVKINDTAEAVNKVLGEKTAGKDEDGSVDLIWINGENFATLKQATPCAAATSTCCPARSTSTSRGRASPPTSARRRRAARCRGSRRRRRWSTTRPP
jgi:putative spermidine/putrescine transport system substrate-binding protein